nr:helix-turn-helix transcriptional regulator [Eubacterium sp.]
MSFGQNLQFLRKMSNKMTQEELAERLGVSRQTISKWELDAAYPEMDKVIEICKMFSCSMDELIREDMNVSDDAYSDIRFEEVEAFRYIKYTVVSMEPEEDAISHVERWAEHLHIDNPQVIGWDFPVMSQELINVYNMHGYEAALILPEDLQPEEEAMDVVCQEKQKYIVITIQSPEIAPFRLIPNAYKILMTHMNVNGINHKQDKKVISCFEKEYVIEDVAYMDVYIAIE